MLQQEPDHLDIVDWCRQIQRQFTVVLVGVVDQVRDSIRYELFRLDPVPRPDRLQELHDLETFQPGLCHWHIGKIRGRFPIGTIVWTGALNMQWIQNLIMYLIRCKVVIQCKTLFPPHDILSFHQQSETEIGSRTKHKSRESIFFAPLCHTVIYTKSHIQCDNRL